MDGGDNGVGSGLHPTAILHFPDSATLQSSFLGRKMALEKLFYTTMTAFSKILSMWQLSDKVRFSYMHGLRAVI